MPSLWRRLFMLESIIYVLPPKPAPLGLQAEGAPTRAVRRCASLQRLVRRLN